MVPNITPAVANALEAAQQWAHRLEASEVLPGHLLQGLLQDEEGRACTLLVQAGLDLAAFRRMSPDPGPAPPQRRPASLPLARETELVLRKARLLASESADDRTLASEYALLALLSEPGPLRQELESIGLDFSRLAEATAARPGESLHLDEPLDIAVPTEQIDAARILDASANRAREALRVIEDYCRFALDDTFLSRELKTLRHGLTEVLAYLPIGAFLEARETLRDVGTTLTTPAEQTRHSLEAVLQANCKRLQEALRSLEEYGKLHGPRTGGALEKLRYRSYTLERALLLGSAARQRLRDVRLYLLVTASRCLAALDWTIHEAAAGGANIIQLREKELDDRRLLARAQDVRRWTREAGVLFIVNDRPDIARLVQADGVHLGQDDLPVREARRILGPNPLIGVSTHTVDQVRQALLDGASYVGIGPTFPSGTKDFAELAGLEFVRRAAAETSVPAFVLGGIGPDTIGAAVAAGARRVAVSQAICAAEDPRAVAAQLLQALNSPARNS
jgi:thiamine-phosphate pyrophosphorylase